MTSDPRADQLVAAHDAATVAIGRAVKAIENLRYCAPSNEPKLLEELQLAHARAREAQHWVSSAFAHTVVAAKRFG